MRKAASEHMKKEVQHAKCNDAKYSIKPHVEGKSSLQQKKDV